MRTLSIPAPARRDPNFYGFGRLETDANGECVFETVKPGPVPDGSGGTQAPHINVIVLARGLLKHLYTRVYFAGEPANAHDPVLALVPEERRATLLAQPVRGAARHVVHRDPSPGRSAKPSSSTCKIDTCSRD